MKKNEIRVIDVPEEYENNKQIVEFERKAGMRATGKRGFDIISDSFFAEEEFIYTNGRNEESRFTKVSTFNSFDSYCLFLDGDIFENACYTFHHLSEEELKQRGIDTQRLFARESFVEKTIDDYTLSVSEEERERYQEAERIHKHCKRWIKKFNACKSCSELVKVTNNYGRSSIAGKVDLSFFFFNYIYADIKSKKRFKIIMEYMSLGEYPEGIMINGLCSIYSPKDVLAAYNYSYGSKGTIYRHKKKLKDYVQKMESGDVEFTVCSYFDKKTHFFCEITRGYDKENREFPISTTKRFFETFGEFIKYRKGNLSCCDLSAAIELKIDFSNYITDSKTKLPRFANKEIIYSVKKYFREGTFFVEQQWCNCAKSIIKENKHEFKYFFDFVAFLRGDLADADLLFCDGLSNLKDWNNITWDRVRMRSELYQKFGLAFESFEIRSGLIKVFENIEHNEEETLLALENRRDLIEETEENELMLRDFVYEKRYQKVHYISDIHLMHRIQNSNCRSLNDIEYVIEKIVNTISDEAGQLLLIDGDVSSDYIFFQFFVKKLYQTLRRNTLVVFTLGNHELWSFPGLSVDEIVSEYRSFLGEYNMYLLHNDLLFKEDAGLFDDASKGTHLIKYEDLRNLKPTQLVNQLRNARYVILGGLGFSGYNTEFNADNGIYRDTVNRCMEILESQKFEALYNQLYPMLSRKNSIIMTHTPKGDWCKDPDPQKDFVYVSGHTHRNFFFDDGENRVYADNQIGYHSENIHLKYLWIDKEYDCFDDYEDGVYEITREQYIDFYRGKNLTITFQRRINVLYMLKKKGYYCFIHKSKNGNLTILNGGAMKCVEMKEIQYYYDHMDEMIASIKKPLDAFSAFQKRISEMIRTIGGTGTIHGCIVDIDFYNHIFVNPIDSSVTGYWAGNIINKVVYSSITALLESNCPHMYNRYVRLAQSNQENPFALEEKNGLTTKPQAYFDTDIYKASREIKKMQKIDSNILSFWYDDTLKKPLQIDRV